MTMADCDSMVSSATGAAPTDCIIIAPNNDDMISINADMKDELQEDALVDADTGIPITSMPPSLANPTLQGLLSSPVSMPSGQLLTTTDGIQIIAVNGTSDLLPSQGDGRIWQVVHPDIATIIAVNSDQSEFEQKTDISGIELEDSDSRGSNDGTIASSQDSILMPPPTQPLPPDIPQWAQRLKCCEKIGDSYRGYVETESDLDLLLTYHKQHTQSFWGTRQSPSPAKPSTRLMWKSQYVPFDGIPFVNSGSRAVVMECQFGPRRKGYNKNRIAEQTQALEYRQTCPARIYVKRVKKFPEYAVDVNMDKKAMKLCMDNAFHELKIRGTEGIGQDRFYVQLPTEKAHEFHGDLPMCSPVAPPAAIPFSTTESEPNVKQRLDPRIAQKIRELVAAGETRVYAVRKQLRHFVIRVLYQGNEIPERHDLTLFPTVNDLKNHIHQALKDIETGSLAVTAPQVNVEVVSGQTNTDHSPTDGLQGMDGSMWQQQSTTTLDGSEPVPETVTVTLTQNPGEDGHHVISRIETHLSDGSTRISTHLTPETAQLLSRLHPNMFPSGFILPQDSTNTESVSADDQIPEDVIKTESEEGLAIDSLETNDDQSDSLIDNSQTPDIESLAVVTNGEDNTQQELMTSVDTDLPQSSHPSSLVNDDGDDDHSIENQFKCVAVAMTSDNGEVILGDISVSDLQAAALG